MINQIVPQLRGDHDPRIPVENIRDVVQAPWHLPELEILERVIVPTENCPLESDGLLIALQVDPVSSLQFVPHGRKEWTAKEAEIVDRQHLNVRCISLTKRKPLIEFPRPQSTFSLAVLLLDVSISMLSLEVPVM